MKQHHILLAFSTYCILITSVIAGQHLITVWGVSVSSGMFIFPFSYVLIAVMAECWGARVARRIILYCTLMNIIMLCLIYMILHIPSEQSSIGSAAVYDLFLRRFAFVLMVSTLAFTVSECVNVFLLSRLKLLTQGKYFVQRALCSTLCAVTLDTLIVFPFYLSRQLSLKHALFEASMGWGLKILMDVVVLPLSVFLMGLMGRRYDPVLPPSAIPFTSTYYLKQYG